MFPVIMTTRDGKSWIRQGGEGTGGARALWWRAYFMGACGMFICMCIPPMSDLMVAMLMFA